ncbi:MAG TPA: coproporphyrinogen III oxidase family protein, partial [Polyangiales bacterium]|nr:coproporphyrinogen III oxidase family protein [Polyangiales bacterium]
ALPDFEETLDAQAIVREGFLLGLRTEAGVDAVALAARAGIDPREGRAREVERAQARGNLICTPERWHVPRDRWLFLDAIVADLF